MPLSDFTEEAWDGLLRGEDEVAVGIVKQRILEVEAERKRAFESFVASLKSANENEKLWD